MRGVGEHHHRADGHTDHGLHDGETDVDRGSAREPARTRLVVPMVAVPMFAEVVAAVILIH